MEVLGASWSSRQESGPGKTPENTGLLGEAEVGATHQSLQSRITGSTVCCSNLAPWAVTVPQDPFMLPSTHPSLLSSLSLGRRQQGSKGSCFARAAWPPGCSITGQGNEQLCGLRHMG